MKNSEQWPLIERLFHQAQAVDPAQRAAFLVEACGEDDALRREVESLLGYENETRGFLGENALAVAARQFEADKSRPLTMAGERIGVYTVSALLGKGGMGEVWLATDSRLGRRVALKLLPAEFGDDSAMVRRFEREARAASALNHPNILTVHDIGQHGAMRYIATEHVEGETLRRRLSRGPLTLTETVQIMTQLVSALSAAHQAGIIHRDLKPENVMLRPDGLVKVLDFGLAKQTQPAPEDDDEAAAQHKLTTTAGMVIGTPSYMSPEQARGKKLDARTDIFSLGVMLHEMVTGELPFRGSTSLEIIAAILEREPPSLTTAPRELTSLVNKALQKDRQQRYADIAEFQADLKTFEKELARHPAWAEWAKGPEGDDPSEKRMAPSANTGTTVLHQPQPSNDTNPPAPVKRPLWRRAGRFVLRAAVVVVLLGLLTAGGFWFYDWIRKPAIDSVAVLPFANLDNNADAEYLCVGLSDSLINHLSRMYGLMVSARGASFRFNSKSFDPQTVAGALGVRAIVSGSISQRNGRLQIAAELMDVQTKRRLWGESYDRPPNDLVAVQTDIARQVSEKLRVWLSGEIKAHFDKQQKIDAEAYRLYLKAGLEAERGTSESLKKAIELLNQALTIEPQYAEAWGGMSGAYTTLYLVTQPATQTKEGIAARDALREEYKKKAEAALQKARELDPNPAGVPEMVNHLQQLQANWDWDNLERESRYYLALAPNDLNLLAGLSMTLSFRGQHEEAVLLAQRMYNLEPLSSSSANRYAQALMFARRYDEAIALLEQKKQTNNASLMTHIFLANCYRYKGMLPQAQAELDAADQSLSARGEIKNSVEYISYLIAAGWRAEAVELLNKMLASGDEDGSGVIYALLGEKEKALTALEKELARRTPNMELLGIMPELDSLRAEPRFQEILRQIGAFKPAR
ncbi:MAG: protein kinase [Acidobacteria bacterium]|nr:protein kinase [Acidobacteriota bacterium]